MGIGSLFKNYFECTIFQLVNKIKMKVYSISSNRIIPCFHYISVISNFKISKLSNMALVVFAQSHTYNGKFTVKTNEIQMP